MKQSSVQIQQLSQNMTPIIESQASATQEIHAAIEELNKLAQQLVKVAQTLQR